MYLTDEVFLYRVAGWTVRGTDDVVELEDCYRLDVVEVPVRNVRARRLRVVTPSAGNVTPSLRPRESPRRTQP
jgi:hypothetical protein